MSLLVEIVRILPATPDRVYDAWLDPAALSHFLRPAPGVTVSDVSLDAQVNGVFSLTMHAGETQIPVRGIYQQLDRPNTLSFTWHSARTEAHSLVTLRFEAEGEQTRMTLRHTDFPDVSSRDDHEGGWRHILDSLQSLLNP